MDQQTGIRTQLARGLSRPSILAATVDAPPLAPAVSGAVPAATAPGRAVAPPSVVPVWGALLVLWITVGGLWAVSVRAHGGRFTYALDDPYIHMAMAKNFARHGVWGVTPDQFSSSSSALAWTALIALIFHVAGQHEMVPFLLCLSGATVVVWLVDSSLRRYAVTARARFVALLLIIFVTPLPTMIFTGQEHVLHILLTLLFVQTCTTAVAATTAGGRRQCLTSLVSLYVLSALLPLARYEGLFLVLIGVVAWIRRGRLDVALTMGVAAAVPVGLYGLVSIAHGWYLLPNSVLLKGNAPHITSLAGIINLLSAAPVSLILTPVLLCLFVMALAVYIVRRSAAAAWEPRRLALVFFMAAVYLHLQFARTSVFFRYEAYLVVLGLWALAAVARDVSAWGRRTAQASRQPSLGVARLRRGLMAGGVTITLLSLGDRAVHSLSMTPVATTNIYDQQYQMARFVQRYYPGASIALNDIGFVDYLTDVHCLDLWGLASREIAAIRLAGTFDRDRIATIAAARSVRVAVVFDRWFDAGPGAAIAAGHAGGMPRHWIQVGQWQIPHNVVCGQDTVTWYATTPSEARRLIADLKRFAPSLPREVRQSGSYTAP